MGETVSYPSEAEKITECPICRKRYQPGASFAAILVHIDNCTDFVPQNPYPPALALPPGALLEKHTNFRNALSRLKTPWQQGATALQFDREELLLQSSQQLCSLSPEAIRGEYQITFSGEEVSDAGGAVKEWLSKVNEILLAAETGLYRFTETEGVAYRFHPCLPSTSHWLAYLHGMILGIALLDGVPLNCPLAIVLYKRLLGQELSIHDLKFVNQPAYSALEFIYRNDITGVLFNHFIVEEAVHGCDQLVTIPLCEGGGEIALTEENKVHYISLLTEWHLTKNCEEGNEVLRQGFERVVPRELLAGISAEELELEVCGRPDIDVDDWRANTEYRGYYHSRHPIILCFWSTLAEFSQSDLSLLLKFVMGTSRLPVEGFRTLKTLRGDSAKFTIQSVEYCRQMKYPRAHTCFNRLDLPMYTTWEELKECLKFVLRTATKICLCVYPCARICDEHIGKHCSQSASGHSLEPIAALSLIQSRGDIPAFFARQQLFQEVADGLSANLTSFRAFKTEVESMFTQIDTYRMSKMAEISAAERSLEGIVSTCLAQLESLRFAQIPQARNRFEFILSQGASLNLSEIRKELTMFGATFGQPAQSVTSLDAAIRVIVATGIHTRPANQVLAPPQLPAALGPANQSSELTALQQAISELRMENAAKDQTLATVKNNRDELKTQYSAKRQEYEQTINELKKRIQAGGAAASPSHLQGTIEDMKDERQRLISEKKQYEEALRIVKGQYSELAEKARTMEAMKDKIEKDALMMALMLRDKLPQMERQLKETSAEKDALIELRNRLERLFGSLPMINIGCNEGQAVVQAQRYIRAQKSGEGDGVPGFIRFVVI